MKIGIDVSQILYGTGVSFYTSSLVKSLSEINKKDEFLLFASSLRAKDKLKKELDRLRLDINFKPKTFPFPPLFLEKLWNNLHIGRIECFLGNIDVFHASDWTQPPSKRAGLVTTIHDLAFFKYPNHFASRIISNHKKRLRWIAKDRVEVIAVSKATKKDILKYTDIKADKITVIYEAIPKSHQLKVSEDEVEEFKKDHKLANYLLFVGVSPRKNLKTLVSAFNILKKSYPNLKLVVVGKKQWDKDARIAEEKDKEESRIIFWEDASSKTLALLYAGASCFVYPSLYEGFGLPVLEAMYYGCPVVASNASSIPEVAGKAGVLVDPKSELELIKALHNVLKNETLKFKLKNLGFEQIKKFSWETAAKKTLRVYERVKNAV
jgi:glycosyltransferase involved in cell wall biosynthesis